MATHPPIDPGPDHVTVFGFDGQKTVFQTHHQTDKAANSSNNTRNSQDATAPPGDKGSQPDRSHIWTIHVPGAMERAERTVDPWKLQWPGVASPGQFTVHRSFDNLEDVRSAIPEITDFANRAGSLHPDKPHLVLTAPHFGALDTARVISIADNLRRAGTDATIIVDHRSISGG